MIYLTENQPPLDWDPPLIGDVWKAKDGRVGECVVAFNHPVYGEAYKRRLRFKNGTEEDFERRQIDRVAGCEEQEFLLKHPPRGAR